MREGGGRCSDLVMRPYSTGTRKMVAAPWRAEVTYCSARALAAPCGVTGLVACSAAGVNSAGDGRGRRMTWSVRRLTAVEHSV